MAKLTPQLLASTYLRTKADWSMAYDRPRDRVIALLADGTCTEFHSFDIYRELKDLLGQADADKAITRGLMDEVTFNMKLLLPPMDSETERGLCFTDGFLPFSAFLAGGGGKLTAVPTRIDGATYSTCAYPFGYAEAVAANARAADEPNGSRWRRFLGEVLVRERGLAPDPELARFAQEMAGYLMWPDLRTAAAFFMVGEGANGKSVMIDTLQEMVGGKRHYTALSLESLTTQRFAPALLVGKKVNFCSEEESKYLRSDKFKALTTGDAVLAEQKYEPSFTFRNTAKFVFATNNMPTFDGIDHGIKRRMRIIPFLRRFEGKERDPFLADELKRSLPEIVGWGLEGMTRLAEQNFQFSGSESMARRIAEFEEETSSAIEFLREHYIEDEDGRKPTGELYGEYRDWCLKNGRKAMGNRNFGKDLSRACSLEPMAMRDVRGEVVRGRKLIPRPAVLIEDVLPPL